MSPLNANLPSRAGAAVGAEREATRTATAETSPVAGRTDQGGVTVAAAIWNCLVLSADPTRRDPLCEASERAGWRAVPCGSVGDAIRQVERWRTQLAVVDLGSMPEVHKETYRRFSQKIAGRDEPLLVICEDEPAPSTELWARQVGVWIYLPSPELGEDLVKLFAEALRVAEKLSGAGQKTASR